MVEDALTAALLLVTRHDELSLFQHYQVVGAALILIIVLTFVLFVVAGGLLTFLGKSILEATTKIIGMLLGAFAVEFIINGIVGAMALHANGISH